MVVILLLCWLTGAPSCRAAERALSFTDAVKLAFENNHEIRAMDNAALASREGIGIARSSLLPRLTFEERYLRTVNPGYAFMTKLNQQRIDQPDFLPVNLNNPDPISDFQTLFFLEQPLFTRKGLLGLEMSKTDARAKDEEALRKKEEIVFQLVQGAISLDTAKAFLGAMEKSVADAKEQLRITELRQRTGLGQYADTLRAATALSAAEQRKISAEKNLRVAKRGLGLLLGLEEDIEILNPLPDLPLRDLAACTQRALSRRDIKSGELREENARKNIKLAEAGYFPYVGVGGAYQLNDHNRPLGTEGNNWQVTAFLRWDLFDGTKREYERTRAKYEAASAQEQLSGLKKAISYRVYEVYLSIDEAQRNVDLARRAALAAEEGKRLVQLRYENGLYPLVDLLNAQAGLDQARAGLVAREGERRLATARLSYESGAIMQDLNLEK